MQVYQIKKGRKWQKVQSPSMRALNAYCNENGFSDWRIVGMMSRSEMIAAKSLPVVGA